MRQDHTRPSGGERQRLPPASWRHVRWFSVCSFLLVAACTTVPAPSAAAPMATGSGLPTTITDYHGHISTVSSRPGSPTDGRRIPSGGNDSTVQL